MGFFVVWVADCNRVIFSFKVSMVLRYKRKCNLTYGRFKGTAFPVPIFAILHTISNIKHLLTTLHCCVTTTVSHRLVLRIFPNFKQYNTASAMRMLLLRNLKHVFHNFPHRLGPRSWIQSATSTFSLNIPIFTHIYRVSRNKTSFLSSLSPFQPPSSSIGTANSSTKIYAREF